MAHKLKSKLPIAHNKATPVATTNSIDKERERKYQAEDALRTLKRADEIKRDKELMRDVKSCAKAEMKTLKSL